MRAALTACAALVAALMPMAAWADDPNDPTMRSPAARARDHEIIRQLNQRELAHVQQRDARYAEGWRDYRAQRGGNFSDNQRAVSTYARRRAQYEREMDAWHHAVAACRNGDYSYCDR